MLTNHRSGQPRTRPPAEKCSPATMFDSRAQSRERAGRPGWGRSTSNRSTTTLYRHEQQVQNHTTISRCPRQEHARRPQATAALTLADGQSRTPLIPQNVQTDRPVRVDVRVVDSGGKADFGGLEGVVCASASEHQSRGDPRVMSYVDPGQRSSYFLAVQAIGGDLDLPVGK